MATIFSHPAIALALSPWFRETYQLKSVILAGAILTIIPDIDVIGLRLGIPYGHLLGHRGITHSLIFAVLLSGIVAWNFYKIAGLKLQATWVYLFLCMASHGVLDALTNGGLGIAFFAPLNNDRYFFPWTPIEVSPLDLGRFFQGDGVPVLRNEIVSIWLPCSIVFLAGIVYRKKT